MDKGRIIITDYKNRLVAVFIDEKRQLQDICACREESLVDNIYVGRVTEKQRQLGAFFAEISPGVKVFVPAEDERLKKLAQDDRVLLQITKDAKDKKCPVASMAISLGGNYLLLHAGDGLKSSSRKVFFSKKIKNFEFMDSIAPSIEKLLEEENFQAVVRTAAEGADREAVFNEAVQLKDRLKKICDHYLMRSFYSCMHKREADYVGFIRDNLKNMPGEIVTDKKEIYDSLQEGQKLLPVRLYQDENLSLNKLYSLESHIEALLKRRVYLPCGGYLVFDSTEAMQVIDVNSGKCEDKNKLAERVNGEAVTEAARQIRLRNLSGMILIDFINTDGPGEQLLLENMKRALLRDKNHPRVVDITPLGIMEITRRRSREPIMDIFE